MGIWHRPPSSRQLNEYVAINQSKETETRSGGKFPYSKVNHIDDEICFVLSYYPRQIHTNVPGIIVVTFTHLTVNIGNIFF